MDRGYADKVLKAKVKNAIGMDVTLTHPDMKTAGALSAEKVSRSRAIASCRAVVEQVNCRLKEQEILGGKYPLRETDLLQSVLHITAHLCNNVYRPLYDLDDNGTVPGLPAERHIIGALPDFVVPAAVLPVPDATDASTKAAARRLLLAEIGSIDSDFWSTSSDGPELTPASRSTVEPELRPSLETAIVSEDYLTDDELAEEEGVDDCDREAEAAERSRQESEAKALVMEQLEKLDSGEKVNLADLKSSCKRLGISTPGKKQDVVHRLRSAALGVAEPSKGKARTVRAKVPAGSSVCGYHW